MRRISKTVFVTDCTQMVTHDQHFCEERIRSSMKENCRRTVWLKDVGTSVKLSGLNLKTLN